jgi:hypothetical protein
VPISDGVTQLGLIPRLKTGWTKDVDLDRMVNLDENNFAEIWIQQNDGYIYTNDSFIIPPEIWGASIETLRTVKVTLSRANGTAGPGFSLTGEGAPAIVSAEKVKDLNGGQSSSNKQWLITTATDIPLGATLRVEHTDPDPTRVFGSRQLTAAGVFTATRLVLLNPTVISGAEK